jgi:hypothetical protein
MIIMVDTKMVSKKDSEYKSGKMVQYIKETSNLIKLMA